MRKGYVIKVLAIASLVASLAMVGGCAKKAVQTDDGSKTAAVSKGDGEKRPALGDTESLESKPWSRKDGAISEGRTSAPLLPVYFDFDKSNIRKDQAGRLEKNAEYLKANSATRVIIEGNCDERGTNEYNMALGERRALGAKKYLANLGVSDDRMRTISYGEEKPLEMGHDESAWTKNRRDDFVLAN